MKVIKILFGITLITGILGGLSLLTYNLGHWKFGENLEVELTLLYVKLTGSLLVLASRIALEATILYFFYMLIFHWKVNGVVFEFENKKQEG